MMLFHITISHSPSECPGRRPTEPPDLVGPSDKREALARELGVTLHFVLWGASCMLWAQPEHLAFAVLEAEDVESALHYVGGLVPQGWTCDALPVWNLPAQLRLVRQVRVAPPLKLGQGLPSASASDESQSTPSREPPPVKPRDRLAALAADAEPTSAAAGGPNRGQGGTPANSATDPGSAVEPLAPANAAPSTITRLLRDLDAAEPEPAAKEPTGERDRPVDQTERPADMGTRIITQRAETSGASAGRAWLVATTGPAKGKTFVVTQQGATIGRLPESPVSIADERLSREHAKVDFRNGGFWLTDLGSTNGTAVNGVLLTAPRQLASGDTIELGSSVLVVTIEPPPHG